MHNVRTLLVHHPLCWACWSHTHWTRLAEPLHSTHGVPVHGSTSCSRSQWLVQHKVHCVLHTLVHAMPAGWYAEAQHWKGSSAFQPFSLPSIQLSYSAFRLFRLPLLDQNRAALSASRSPARRGSVPSSDKMVNN